MPHTINLVSQFEDIIRRGGNELDNNISNAVRAGWVRKTAPRKARSRRKRIDSESDESPPPIPKRSPITQYTTVHNYTPGKVTHSENDQSYLDNKEKLNYANEENQIITISKNIEVCFNKIIYNICWTY
jgi:hypothetical protein